MDKKDIYAKLYKNIRSGKYDIVAADAETFEMETRILFADLLRDCNKYGVDMENFLRYLKEQEEGIKEKEK